jgi:ML-like domain
MWHFTVALLASSALLPSVLGADILKTDGFTNCNNGNSTINVKNVDIQFDRNTNEITFDVAGSSSREQDVTAELIVTAYGVNVYSQSFDPCAEDTKVDQLCPGMSIDYSHSISLLTYSSSCW